MAKICSEVCKMQKIYLKGEIEKFGSVWNADVRNLKEAFKLIDCQTKGFGQYIADLHNKNRTLDIVVGEDIIEDPEDFLVHLNKGDIIITEVPQGAGDNPLAFIAAAVLVVVAGPAAMGYLTGAGTAGITAGQALFINTLAINLAITGISMALAPGPETDIPEGAEEEAKAQFFNGPANVSKEGIPIPLLYGELIVGGAAIYSSLNTADFDIKQNFQQKMEESIRFGA